VEEEIPVFVRAWTSYQLHSSLLFIMVISLWRFSSKESGSWDPQPLLKSG
jgi:hypothetical protein